MTRRVVLVCQRSNNVPFSFDAAVANGIALTVIASPDEKPPMHMPGVDDALIAPVFDDPDSALDMLTEYASRVRVDGIVTQREEAIVWTARAAERLGLHSITPDAARAARDKGEMRRRFRTAGLNTPFYVKIKGTSDLAGIERSGGRDACSRPS